MANLDFPATPTVGQLYVAGNGVTYRWTGTMWLAVGSSSSTFFGELPPATPGLGQLWFHTGLATLYIFYDDGNSQQWVPTNPVPAPAISPTIIPTGLIQSKRFRSVTMLTGATQFMSTGNDQMPVITQGNEYMTLAFTPLSAASRLLIDVVVYGSFAAAPGLLVAALFQDAVTNALASGALRYPVSGALQPITVSWDGLSGSTTARTFRVRAGGNQAGTFTFNGEGGVRVAGGSLASSITINEVP